MTALLEAARTVSNLRRGLAERRKQPSRRAKKTAPDDPERLLLGAFMEIETNILEPYFKAGDWTKLESSWHGWIASFKPPFETLMKTLGQAMQADQFSADQMLDASRSFYSLISDRMDEPLKSNFRFSTRILENANGLIIKNAGRIISHLESDDILRDYIESTLAGLSLSVMILARWLELQMQGRSVSDHHLDFAVIAVKRYTAALYMTLRRASGK